MGPTWGPPGPCRTQLGPMLAPWTLLSGAICHINHNSIQSESIRCLGWIWNIRRLNQAANFYTLKKLVVNKHLYQRLLRDTLLVPRNAKRNLNLLQQIELQRWRWHSHEIMHVHILHGGLTKPLLKFRHGWVIYYHRQLWYVITYPCPSGRIWLVLYDIYISWFQKPP